MDCEKLFNNAGAAAAAVGVGSGGVNGTAAAAAAAAVGTGMTEGAPWALEKGRRGVGGAARAVSPVASRIYVNAYLAPT